MTGDLIPLEDKLSTEELDTLKADPEKLLCVMITKYYETCRYVFKMFGVTKGTPWHGLNIHSPDAFDNDSRVIAFDYKEYLKRGYELAPEFTESDPRRRLKAIRKYDIDPELLPPEQREKYEAFFNRLATARGMMPILVEVYKSDCEYLQKKPDQALLTLAKQAKLLED
ncbi:MAG: hypothetical protein Q8O89_01655 [Nanoarchaeota archaeon]|nr:hypothetical protein [Nanoarchaeota archaeon]